MVCEPALAFCAREIELGEYLLLGKERMQQEEGRENLLLLMLWRALIGAIYVDGGFANAKEFINRFILKDLENKKLFYDSKTILQEIVQAHFKKNFLTIWLGKRDRTTIKLSGSRLQIGGERLWMVSERTQKRLPNRKLPTRPS